MNEKTTRHNAIALCKCGKYIHSAGGGRFKTCSCGDSFIDQERWGGMYVCTGGDAKFIEQICPHGCEYPDEHKNNKKIEDFKELKKYLKSNYKIIIK